MIFPFIGILENLPYNPVLKRLTREKRKAGILSEVLFWQQVHKRKFHRIDFDRQRIIGSFIVDFYVKALGLVVEIDGCSHDDKVEYDARRQEYLENLGLSVYRIDDKAVKSRLETVMIELEEYIIREYGERTTPAFSQPSTEGEFSSTNVFNYIYAILHSHSSFKNDKEKGLPKIPCPKNQSTFWQFVKFGEELRQIK